MEDFLKNINVIIQKDNPNELEQRILNAIDVYGLSDDNTPLHVKFLLCVICLEGLLLSSSDKDYLGWKLSEKITMLLGDTKQWCLHLYAYEDPYLTREKYEEFAKNLTDKYVEDHLVESREKLFKKITTIYGKRSSFAHSVLKSKRKEQDSISEEDYLYAFLILRWIIELFLRLSENGISHIGKMKEEDEASLDVYLQRMKYRQKNTITGDI